MVIPVTTIVSSCQTDHLSYLWALPTVAERQTMVCINNDLGIDNVCEIYYLYKKAIYKSIKPHFISVSLEEQSFIY